MRLNQLVNYFVVLMLSAATLGQAATTSSDIQPWPQATMPFIIEDEVPKNIKQLILKAIDRINALHIVKLIKVSGNYNGTYAVFTYNTKGVCSAGYGWNQDTNNLIKISNECTYGSILHEIFHALGILHEQLNPLRSSVVIFDRLSGMQDQYIYNNAKSLTDYDMNSIMHYSSIVNGICANLQDLKWNNIASKYLPHSSCRNKNWLTLTAKNNSSIDCRNECAVIVHPTAGLIEGQRNDLSPLDIEGLRSLYNQK